MDPQSTDPQSPREKELVIRRPIIVVLSGLILFVRTAFLDDE